MPRVFFAIPMPLAVRETFLTCRQAAILKDPDWAGEKWVASENLHVTLRFLGTIPVPAAQHCAERVGAVLADLPPYRLRLDALRAVPQRRSASLIWVAPSAGADATAVIAERIERATSFLDFEPDGRRFRPHVTLCRARRPRRVSPDAFDEMERILLSGGDRATTVSVRSVTLFSSTLTPRGPIYEEMAILPLGC